MPKDQASEFRFAEAQQIGRRAYIYVIEHGDELYHLTGHDVDIVVTDLPVSKGSDPQTFTAANIGHSTIEQKAEIGANEMSLSVGVNQGAFTAQLRELVLFTTPKKITVTIIRVNSTSLPGTIVYGADTYTVFKGVGTALVFEASVIQLSLVSLIMQTDGLIPLWTYQKTCQLPFGGTRCGLNLDQNAFRLVTTLAAVNFRGRYVDIANITLNGDAITAAMFQGGKMNEIESGNAISTISIMACEVLPAAAGTRLYLAWWSRTIEVGQDVKVFRSCNRTFAQCVAFGNTDNFRNYPYIPDVSPAIHGV